MSVPRGELHDWLVGELARLADEIKSDAEPALKAVWGGEVQALVRTARHFQVVAEPEITRLTDDLYEHL